MKRSVLMVLIGLVLSLSMALGLLYGCPAPSTPTGTQPTGTAPTTSAPPTTKAGQTWKLKVQSGGAASSWGYIWMSTFLENVTKATAGRMTIELLPVGSIVSNQEMFDAVSTGALDIGTVSPCSNWTTEARLAYSCNIMAGLDYNEFMTWVFADQVGGEEMSEAAWADWNIHAIPFQISPPEAEWLSNEPLTSAEQMKGKKFRGLGWANNVMKEPEFACNATFIPGAELYAALQTGVIDFMEYEPPHNNWAYGLHEVAKYQSFPGIHQLARDSTICFNGDLWKSFPEDIQTIITMCAARQTLVYGANTWYECAVALDKQLAYGQIQIYQPPELQALYKQVSWRLAEQHVIDNPKCKPLWESQKALIQLVRPYMRLQTPNYGEEEIKIEGIQGL